MRLDAVRMEAVLNVFFGPNGNDNQLTKIGRSEDISESVDRYCRCYEAYEIAVFQL